MIVIDSNANKELNLLQFQFRQFRVYKQSIKKVKEVDEGGIC